MKNLAGLLPLIMLGALCGAMWTCQSDQRPGIGGRNESPGVELSDSEAPVSQGRKGGDRPRGLPLAGPERKAEDFPYNLNTFEDWDAISSEQMANYRTSIVSRVGRWDTEKIERFFYRVDPLVQRGAARRAFQSAVLGVWCAKDVDACLASIEENYRGREASEVKQAAMGGWAQDDWISALRFIQKHGDRAVESRLGGDSSAAISMIAANIYVENGKEEAHGFIESLQSSKNKMAAQRAMELQNRPYSRDG